MRRNPGVYVSRIHESRGGKVVGIDTVVESLRKLRAEPLNLRDSGFPGIDPSKGIFGI